VGKFRSLTLCLAFGFAAGAAAPASAEESILKDENGDGAVSLLAFGDSITYGLGDGADVEASRDLPPAGYPKRVSNLASVPVSNVGLPGEEFILDGAARFARQLSRSNADIVLFLEGANDALKRASTDDYRNKVQRVINSTTAIGKVPVLLTIPPTCCGHAGSRPFIESFNRETIRLANLNSSRLADLERAWKTTCQNQEECELFNDDGLHPNAKGYSVIAQTVLAALYGIDIFAPDGAGELAAALGVDPTTILVKPEITPTETAPQ